MIPDILKMILPPEVISKMEEIQKNTIDMIEVSKDVWERKNE